MTVFRPKVDASGTQIHCQASLVMITEFVNGLYNQVCLYWGPKVADVTANAAGNALLDQLEVRLEWSTAELIRWEKDKGFDPNKELTARGARVDKSFDCDEAIASIREQLED